MAATRSLPRRASRWRRALRSLALGRRPRAPAVRASRAAPLLGLLGVLAAGHGLAQVLPEDRAEAMLHVYDGGGVRATGPALLVRKSLADRVSVSGTYYVDQVSNASIDVVTTASPFRERRTATTLGLDYLVRDAIITVSGEQSSEPDYTVRGFGVDVAQEIYGGMTTVSLGFSRSSDDVGRKDVGFFDRAQHWQYRLGATQILSPRWLASANLEVVSDDGFLGSPYRVARVFGATVPERNPRTRTSRAVKLRAVGAVAAGQAVHGDYRYFWDTWGVRAHTIELGYSRYFGEAWLADSFVRFNTQSGALFYSDDAQTETRYVTRNRQLSDFRSVGLGAKLAYTAYRQPSQYEIKVHGALEYMRFDYSDFTDLRNGQAYSFNAAILQLWVSATF